MKLGMLALAIAALAPSAPANAATILLDVDVEARGFTTDSNCGFPGGTCIPTSMPVVRSFQFQRSFQTEDFIGGSAVFRFGIVRADGFFQGTVLSLGSDTFVGRDFLFLQSFTDRLITELSAPTFKVAQVSPAPVPEPASWAMMLIGFGAVGYSMRGHRSAHPKRLRYASQ